MPKIIQYQPNQVGTQVVSKPKMNAAAGNAVFDANISAGRAIAAGATQMRQRIDTTAAEEALVGFEREKNDLFFKPETGYFNQQGKNAYDQMGATNKALQDLRKRYADGLTGDAAAMFGKAADAHITRSQADIQRHGSDGYKVWEISTLDAQVENAIESGSLYWANDERVIESRRSGELAILNSAKLSGISQIALNERIETFRSTFTEAAVEAATLASAEKGAAVLGKYGDYLEPPARAKLESGITKKLEAEDAQFRAERAISTGVRLVETYETREEIRTEVNKIKDPDERKQVMSEAMRQFDLKQRGIAEEQDKVIDAAEEHIYGGQSLASFVATNPDAYNSLTAKQKRSLDKLADGGPAASKSNPILLADLIHQDPKLVAKVNPSMYRDQLSGTEYAKLKKAVFDAGKPQTSSTKAEAQLGRTRNAQTLVAVEALMNSKKKDWSVENTVKANHFFDFLDSLKVAEEARLERPQTSAEFTAMLNGATRDYVQQDYYAGFIDRKRSLDDVVPPESLREYGDYLRSQGIPVTSENLIVLHDQLEAQK